MKIKRIETVEVSPQYYHVTRLWPGKKASICSQAEPCP